MNGTVAPLSISSTAAWTCCSLTPSSSAMRACMEAINRTSPTEFRDATAASGRGYDQCGCDSSSWLRSSIAGDAGDVADALQRHGAALARDRRRPERNDCSSNRHPAPASCWSMRSFSDASGQAQRNAGEEVLLADLDAAVAQ